MLPYIVMAIVAGVLIVAAGIAALLLHLVWRKHAKKAEWLILPVVLGAFTLTFTVQEASAAWTDAHRSEVEHFVQHEGYTVTGSTWETDECIVDRHAYSASEVWLVDVSTSTGASVTRCVVKAGGQFSDLGLVTVG